jgi:putative ABC transport system ATP-binding protein
MDQQQARPDTVVRVVGVRKTYEAEGMPVRALRGVDFEMAPGEFVAVMGPSGCGKSTLLNLVAGLDTPSEGEITVAGEPLAGKDENDLARMRRRHIGIVFQFFNLLEGMTCLENVALPAMIAGSSRKQAERRARDLLDLLGLGDKTASVPGVLSGGQRQRLAIARATPRAPRPWSAAPGHDAPGEVTRWPPSGSGPGPSCGAAGKPRCCSWSWWAWPGVRSWRRWPGRGGPTRPWTGSWPGTGPCRCP